MATSPIYNWPEPDNTDLVKNGALAIRTLGNAIDTTMATMVPKTIVDAKGDLIAGTAADTTSRLAVGNNGETLVADSSTSTGLRYTAGNVSDNPVLNSSMQVWQRGTSFALASATITYTADRWAAYRNATGATVTRQATNDTTNLPFIQYCVRVARDSGNTSTGNISIGQSFESINSIPFAGKTVTFSFYARKGANFSGAGIDAVLYSGTGTDQNYVNGFTGAVNVGVVSTALTTTWTRYSVTGTVGTNVTQLATYFNYYGPTGTAGAADNFEITGVQVDVGSVALPYRSTTGTIQGELAACQRYFTRMTTGATNKAIAMISAYATNSAFGYMPLLVEMRTSPSLTVSSAAHFGVSGVANSTVVQLNSAQTQSKIASLDVTIGTASLTVGRGYAFVTDSASATFDLSAEL